MDVKRCAAVCAAAECGSFSAAAKQLGYTPSGIIRLVDALEAELGFAVLERKTTGVELTQEGKLMLDLFKETVGLDEQMRQVASRVRGVSEGIVRVGCIYGFLPSWIGEVLEDFGHQYPRVALHIQDGSEAALKAMLDERRLDCALIWGNHDSYAWQCLGRCELVAWVPATSELANNSGLLLAELQQEAFIRLNYAGESFAEQLLSHRSIEPDVRAEVLDSAQAYRLVASGLGSCLAIGGLAELLGDPAKDGVAVLPLSPQRSMEYGIITASSVVPSPSVEEFIRLACTHACDWPLLHE